MAESNIEWTDYTFNPWRGCSKVAAGCTNCYAETNVGVKLHGIKWGTLAQGGTRVVAAKGYWRDPLKWNKAVANPGLCPTCHGSVWRECMPPICDACGYSPSRPRVFCASLADVFEDWDGPMVDHKGTRIAVKGDRWTTPGVQRLTKQWGDKWLTMSDVRARLFKLIDATPNLDWMVLTKRPENIRRMWPTCPKGTAPDGSSGKGSGTIQLRNVWLGTSIAEQKDSQNLDELARCRDLCAKTFVSAEPLVGPVDLGPHLQDWVGFDRESGRPNGNDQDGLDLVIVGGESGPRARPCKLDWVRNIVRQCKESGVACFVKQLGSHVLGYEQGTAITYLPRLKLKHPKGGDMDEWPEHLRVREMPISQVVA